MTSAEFDFEFEFEFRATIIGHPAIKLVPVAWGELLDSGFVDLFTVPVHRDYEALICSFRGVPVAFILYEFADKNQTVWINLSYVDPHFRGRGTYSLMFDTLKTKVKDCGCLRILSGIATSNGLIRRSCEANGRTKTAEFWELRI